MKTIHIFKERNAQVVSKQQNGIAKFSEVISEIYDVSSIVWAKKPTDYTGTQDYFLINIFEDLFIDWIPKDLKEKTFRIKYSDLSNTDIAKIDTLTQAILSKN
jgi:hypothetical protein